jgi:hypothetical protein
MDDILYSPNDIQRFTVAGKPHAKPGEKETPKETGYDTSLTVEVIQQANGRPEILFRKQE